MGKHAFIDGQRYESRVCPFFPFVSVSCSFMLPYAFPPGQIIAMAGSSTTAHAPAAAEAQTHVSNGILRVYEIACLCQVPSAVMMMQVVRVAGDGDCLFHALARFDGSDGGALRIDVAEYMEAHAMEQRGFEEAWLREAGKLRASAWGGHTAIVAFSLMNNVRVQVHTRKDETGAVVVEEVSHASIFGNAAMPMQHILYNGKDHYDALTEIVDFTGMVPAWPQPPPPTYFAQVGDEFPPLSASAQTSGRPGRNGFNTPRPTKKGKGKAKGNKGNAEAEASMSTTPAATQHNDEDDEDDENQLGFMDALLNVPVAESSLHPHRQVEDLIKDGCRKGDIGNVTLNARYTCLKRGASGLSYKQSFTYPGNTWQDLAEKRPPFRRTSPWQQWMQAGCGPMFSAPSRGASGQNSLGRKSSWRNTCRRSTPQSCSQYASACCAAMRPMP